MLESDAIRVLHDFTRDSASLVRTMTQYRAQTSIQQAVADERPPVFAPIGVGAIDAEMQRWLQETTNAIAAERPTKPRRWPDAQRFARPNRRPSRCSRRTRTPHRLWSCGPTRRACTSWVRRADRRRRVRVDQVSASVLDGLTGGQAHAKPHHLPHSIAEIIT